MKNYEKDLAVNKKWDFEYDYRIEESGLEANEVHLFESAKSGNDERIRELLNTGANIDAKTRNGFTPLMVAVDAGHYSTSELLLKEGADVHFMDSFETDLDEGAWPSAVSLAARRRDHELLGLLLSHGADVNQRSGVDGDSPLTVAVDLRDPELVRFCLDKGADINIERYSGETPLMTTIIEKDPVFTEFLIESGADVNYRNITGLTALEVAKELGLSEMAEILIGAGAEGEDRLQEHLSLSAKDGYYNDNSVATADYHWRSDDGCLHILVYGLGYLNKHRAMSPLRRFYVRKTADGSMEFFAGSDHQWLIYRRFEHGEMVFEKSLGHSWENYEKWADLYADTNDVSMPPLAVINSEPKDSQALDLDGKFSKLADYLGEYVEFLRLETPSDVESVTQFFECFNFSKKGSEFLGPNLFRNSVNAVDEPAEIIGDVLTDFFKS
ncbi:MAG: ankyrin repeat domain-containing protein [Pseudomonadota bacterium]